MASILLTFIDWLSLVFLSLTLLIGSPANFFTANWTAVNDLIAVLGTSLAFALKGASRIQAFVAGFLLVTVWSLSLFTQ